MPELDPTALDDLRALKDKQDIKETLLRYCRGVDRGDPDLILSAFHDDARDHHGSPQDLAQRMASSPAQGMMHFIGNQLIELEGDTAYSEAYFVSFAKLEDPGNTAGKRLRIRAGRYMDRFERRDGHWKIANRILVDDWSRIDSLGDVIENSRFEGVRSELDPVYRMRELLS